MLGRPRQEAELLAALERIKGWTRARFALPESAVLFVTEITCQVPGCPPRETVIAFWTAPDQRHHWKIFKPMIEVVEADLPPAWMKNALREIAVFGCECC